MKVILELTSGPDAPRSFVIDPGVEVQVGRVAPAQILLPNDRTVSRHHFALEFDGAHCRVRDLGSTHGTMVNGLPVSEAAVTHGDVITAGTSVLRVVLGDEESTDAFPLAPGESPATELPPTVVESVETQEHDVIEPTLHDRVIEVLRSQKEPLFAILDAARDSLILARLLECKERYQSLYEGPEARKLMAMAPYLVSLPRDSAFLAQLVREGWGKSWGVYLTCDRPFEEVRKHLRHFLTVELEGQNKKVLFRFYDPRVLRVFLPTCTPNEASEFVGPIKRLLLEGEDPTSLLEYRNGSNGIECVARTLEPEPR